MSQRTGWSATSPLNIDSHPHLPQTRAGVDDPINAKKLSVSALR